MMPISHLTPTHVLRYDVDRWLRAGAPVALESVDTEADLAYIYAVPEGLEQPRRMEVPLDALEELPSTEPIPEVGQTYLESMGSDS